MTARAVASAALLAAGLHALLGGLLPWLSFSRPLSDAQPGTAYAPYTAAGLALVCAAALLLPPAADRRRLPLVVAAAVPLIVAAAALLLNLSHVVDPGLRTPEVVRLLALAAPPAAVLAPAVLAVTLRRDPARRPVHLPRRLHGRLLVVVLATFGATVALTIAQGAPFGWDESVYGVLARHWVESTPSTGWGPHRPLALSGLGVVPVLLGGADWQLRAVGLSFGLALVAATWHVARSMNGGFSGVLAASVVAGSTSIAFDASLFLTDIPSSTLLVLGLGVLWRAVERPGAVGWSLAWLAPIVAAAFYVRYGAAVPVVGIGLAAALAWPMRLAAAWRQVAATLALLALLLVPHVAFSIAQTGTPLGIVLVGQSAAAPAAAGDGLLEYLDAFPAPLAGLLPAAFMVLGLAGWVHRLAQAGRRRAVDPGARALTLLAVPALFQVVTLGLTIHAEPRYVYSAVVLLVIAGSLLVTDAARARDRPGRGVLVTVGLAAAVSMAVNLVAVPQLARDRTRDWGWEREVGLRIAELAPAGDCVVVAHSVPQTTWYSRCHVVPFGTSREAAASALPAADARFLVIRADGAGQPADDVLLAYLERAEPAPVAVVFGADGREAARVYRFAE
ncbi:MAG TPA: hypothetical protein VFH63_00485 [candidate division Zixibacteria bacterium]|nr:hypothetical protein [candidate division Zixibacteria bacterium]